MASRVVLALVWLAAWTERVHAGPSEASSARSRAPARPNIVLVVFDDLDVAALGCYGSDVHTPTIDGLAAEGLRFTRAYAAAPLCSASRVGLLIGSSPSHLGIAGLIVDGSPRGIPGPVTTIADDLRSAGYRTAFVGKWHVGLERPEYSPLAHGFDTSVRSRGLSRQEADGRLNRYRDFELIVDEREHVPYTDGQHLTDVYVDRVLEFIERDREQPFFVLLSLLTPHANYFPPADYDNSATGYDLASKAGRHAALITHADAELHRIVRRLDELAIADDTLLVVTSDHGGIASVQMHPERPLRGSKGRLQEGGLRVPLVVRHPASVPAGGVNASVVGLIDLRATLREVAAASGVETEGRSFARALRTGAVIERERPLVFEQRRARGDGPHVREVFNSWAVVHGRWKLFLPGLHPSRPREAVPPKLHDLVSDPLEQDDVALEHADVVRRLTEAHRAWRLDVARVPYELASPRATTQDELRFTAGDEPVVLATDLRIDVVDGELSFLLSVRPTAAALEGEVRLAERAGSWDLWLVDGRLRLRLFDERDVTALAGPPLTAERETSVGFTVLDWFTTPQRVRLYVDGAIAAETSAGRRMRSSDEPIRLGGAGFDGVLGRPDVALIAWSTDEIARVIER